MRSTFLSLCVILVVPVSSWGATKGTQKGVGSYLAATNKNALKITVKASRDQAIAGSDFGITAQIENISDQPVYIAPSSFAMTAPPELDSEGPRDWLAFFPGLLTIAGQPYGDTVIVLEPGSNISAFWSGNKPVQSAVAPAGLVFNFCNFVGVDCPQLFRGFRFSPGKYTLTIVGSYWDTYEGAKAKSIERHTQATELQEPINAPQSTILFGAAVGGVIAFLLLSKIQPSSPSGWTLVRWIPGLLSAVLLSMIVTILLARLAESQFIISVTVNDLWGAVAVGFIITASGPTILQKFTALVRGTPPPSPTPTATPTATPPESTVPSPTAPEDSVQAESSSTLVPAQGLNVT
jgi:hypothetical protein